MKTTQERVREHYIESLNYFKENQIVGVFLQGSQNYKLDYDKSDVDTKLIVTPTLREIASNKKAVSTTHVRENDEHIDFKDIRLYMETFRKQNLNFLEILFTKYKIINPLYADEWNRLVVKREEIARMNPFRAVKSMKGIALEKYHAMEHEYPSKAEILAKYGYDGKQLHHLVRVEHYLENYINGMSYEECLVPSAEERDYLMELKRNVLPLDEARVEANRALAHVTEIADKYCESRKDKENAQIRELLEDVQYEIIQKSIRKELGV